MAVIVAIVMASLALGKLIAVTTSAGVHTEMMLLQVLCSLSIVYQSEARRTEIFSYLSRKDPVIILASILSPIF